MSPDCEPVHIYSAWRLLASYRWGFQGPSDRRRRDTIFRARRRSFLRPSLPCPNLPTGDGEPPSAAGCAFWPSGAGASLIALLQYLANRGSDRLLISHRHRRDHRSEVLLVFLEDATLTFEQPSEIYTVLLSETANLLVFELQNRLDLFVGKIARCGYVPDALPHSLFKLAPMRHCFAVGPARGMRGEKCQIVGDCAFDAWRLERKVAKIAALEFRALPGDCAKTMRWRKYLLRNGLA